MGTWDQGSGGRASGLACYHLIQHVLPAPWPFLTAAQVVCGLCPCVSARTLGANPDSVPGPWEEHTGEDSNTATMW